MKKGKYETGCEYPFLIVSAIKINGTKLCEIDIKNSARLVGMPVPDKVRFTISAITKFYKTEEGQQVIKSELEKRARTCGTCDWYETYDGVCCNGNSPCRADFTSKDGNCDHWKKKGECGL